MNASTIRTANAADASGIARVYVRTWRTAYRGLLPPKTLNNMNEMRETLFWWNSLCEVGARATTFVAEDPTAGVVGFVTGGLERRRCASQRAEVYTLYVLPAYQRVGVGTRLLAAVSQRLVAQDLQSLVIWMLAGNPARGFYESLGGAPSASRTICVGGRYVQEVGYAWDDLGDFTATATVNAARRGVLSPRGT